MATTHSVTVEKYTSAEQDGLTTSLWNCGLCSIPIVTWLWSRYLDAILAIMMSKRAAVMWSPFTILLHSTCSVVAPTSPPMLCSACLQSLLSHLCSELPAHSPCQPACIQKHGPVAPANCLQPLQLWGYDGNWDCHCQAMQTTALPRPADRRPALGLPAHRRSAGLGGWDCRCCSPLLLVAASPNPPPPRYGKPRWGLTQRALRLYCLAIETLLPITVLS